MAASNLSRPSLVASRSSSTSNKSLYASAQSTWRRRTFWTPYICIIIQLTINLSFYSMFGPRLLSIELAACREYYNVHQPDLVDDGGYVREDLCKLDTIQERVAWLRALHQIIGYTIGMLYLITSTLLPLEFSVILPLGFLADKFGRRRMLLVNILGQVANWAWTISVCYFYKNFSSHLILLGPVFFVFGGGPHMITALVYGIAAACTPQKDRTAIFSWLESVAQISEMVGPSVGASLLEIDVFIPFVVLLPIAMLSIPSSLLLVDERSPRDLNHDLRPEQEPLLLSPSPADSIDTHAAVDRGTNPPQQSFQGPDGLQKRWNAVWTSLKESGQLLAQSRITQYACIAFLVGTFGKQSMHILMQYISMRFHISIAEAGFLYTIKAVIVLLVFILILPAGKYLKNVHVDVYNVRIARVSIILLAIGSLIMGLSWDLGVLVPGLVIYSSGFGFSTLVRSIATASVPEEFIARLYSVFAAAETIGSLTGASILTAAFTSGISTGGLAIGAPFFVSATTYTLVAALTWTVNLDARTV